MINMKLFDEISIFIVFITIALGIYVYIADREPKKRKHIKHR
ncbi:hypothetical protein ACFL56_03235 [Candidatus Margulisiibacteriota bacterium]